MMIDQINLNYLRIFAVVYQTRSMTEAAHRLHLTQSGISQHVKALEENIGVRLFDRVNKKLVPTEQAATLYEVCQSFLDSIENSLNELKSDPGELRGTVHVGMPDEFGHNIVQPLLVEFCNLYPKVNIKISLGLAPEMCEKLLAGAMDFAFVDDFQLDKRIHVKSIFDEELSLCCSSKYAKSHGLKTNSKRVEFEKVDFIAYEESEEVIHGWFKQHFKGKAPKTQVRAWVVDAKVVAKFITGDVGVGVIPHHLLQKLSDQGHKIVTFKGCGKPLINKIQMAHLQGKTSTRASRELSEWLEKRLSET